MSAPRTGSCHSPACAAVRAGDVGFEARLAEIGIERQRDNLGLGEGQSVRRVEGGRFERAAALREFKGGGELPDRGVSRGAIEPCGARGIQVQRAWLIGLAAGQKRASRSRSRARMRGSRSGGGYAARAAAARRSRDSRWVPAEGHARRVVVGARDGVPERGRIGLASWAERRERDVGSGYGPRSAGLCWCARGADGR
jgi:hypothetical protein